MDTEFHKHCQSTILSIYGHHWNGVQQDGNTTSTIEQLSLPNLVELLRESDIGSDDSIWTSRFLGNENITDDFATVLQIVDDVAKVANEARGISYKSVRVDVYDKASGNVKICSDLLNLSDETPVASLVVGRRKPIEVTVSEDEQDSDMSVLLRFNPLVDSEDDILNINTRKIIFRRSESGEDVGSLSVVSPAEEDLVVDVPSWQGIQAYVDERIASSGGNGSQSGNVPEENQQTSQNQTIFALSKKVLQVLDGEQQDEGGIVLGDTIPEYYVSRSTDYEPVIDVSEIYEQGHVFTFTIHIENTSEENTISFQPTLSSDEWKVKYSKEGESQICQIPVGHVSGIEIVLDTTHKVLVFRKKFSYIQDSGNP